MMLLIEIQVTDNYINLIFKVKAIRKCQHFQLCVLRENSIDWTTDKQTEIFQLFRFYRST